MKKFKNNVWVFSNEQEMRIVLIKCGAVSRAGNLSPTNSKLGLDWTSKMVA